MDEGEYSGTIPAIDKNGKAYYTGRYIRWFGTAGELAVVPLELVEETEGNIFDSGKIKNLEAMINSHDDFYELYAPVGTVHEVTLGDIIEDQRNVANDEFKSSGEGAKVDRYTYLTQAMEVWKKGIQ